MATVRTVTGAAVVLQLKGGGERYLYEGAPVSDAYLASSIAHAVSIGLVGEVEVTTAEEAAVQTAEAEAQRIEAERVAAEKAAADKAAADASQAPSAAPGSEKPATATKK